MAPVKARTIDEFVANIEIQSYAALVGDLYARWTLDSVVEIANAVSKDFIARPEFYRTGQVPDEIVDMRIAYGYTANFPNRAQRQEINAPVFGTSDGYVKNAVADKFHALRKPLFDACIIYSERTIAQPPEGLRQTILSALQLFEPHLRAFEGASIRTSYRQMVSVSNVAFAILRSPGIAPVFGVAPPPLDTWPIDSNDSSGALLIRAVGEKLPLAPELVTNEEKFQRLRRVAAQGRDALQAILADGQVLRDRNFDALVTSIYTWAISLRDYSAS
jgi:hypothetical protein